MNFIWNSYEILGVWIWYEVCLHFIWTSYEINVKYIWNSYELVSSLFEFLIKLVWNIRHTFICFSHEVRFHFIWTSCNIHVKFNQLPMNFISSLQSFQMQFIWTDGAIFHMNDTNDQSYFWPVSLRLMVPAVYWQGKAEAWSLLE